MSSSIIAGPAKLALESLSEQDISFIKSLQKAELHAHLNGCIPISCLQEMAQERRQANNADASQNTSSSDDAISKGLEVFEKGVVLEKIDDFFGLFPAIYALTSKPAALKKVTAAVLKEYLVPSTPGVSAECSYMELRTTPRQVKSDEGDTVTMNRRQYLEAVLDEVEKYSEDQAALIVSVDRRMPISDLTECIDLAISLRNEGRRVVGVDLCGDPLQGDMNEFGKELLKVKQAGLGLTLHIAETTSNTVQDTEALLATQPSRLGHATFLTEEQILRVVNNKIPVEICLSSNLLCKTATSLEEHHIRYYLKHGHPISICTDDILPFRTSVTAEYALLLAPAPYGLGLSRESVQEIAKMSLESRFT